MKRLLSYYYTKALRRLRGKAISNSVINPSSKVNPGCDIVDSMIGRYSYCGYNCKLVNVVIGSFCSIGDSVRIGAAEHPTDWVSMSPVFENTKHSGPNKRFTRYEIPLVKQTVVGSDVWIGYGAIIKQGVSIGHGAVVGSGAVVTKDVPPYAIVGGVPAKVIKYRFDVETIRDLLNSQWWDMPDQDIQKYACAIRDPKEFLLLIANKKEH